MLRNILKPTVLSFVLIAVAHFAYADTLTLKNGQVHKGEIMAEEDERIQIKLDSSGVRLWFLRDQVLSFEKKEPETDKDDSQENKSVPNDASPALDEDVIRAREMLEKLRKKQSNDPKKIQKKKSRTTITKPSSKAKPSKATPTATEGDIDALIELLRNGKTVYVRLDACKELGKTGASKAIPDLIHALDDKTSIIRKAANESLIQITGQDFGYKHLVKRNVRLWAIGKWEKWHNEIKKKESREQLKSLF